MGKALAVVYLLLGVLFGFIGSFSLLSWFFSPDHGGEWSYLLFGFFCVSGSILSFIAAKWIWRSAVK